MSFAHGGAEDVTTTLAPVVVEQNEEDVAMAVETEAPGAGVLVVKRGPNAGTKLVLDGGLVRAGRAPESELFLDDITVSRRHAEFVPVASGYQLRDAGSLNGTYLNRERIESAPLANGDEVQIGKFKLVFLAGGQPGA
jgi:pSer/pThr/pTyr-binding forkhead associated (FHA) protein